MKQEYKNQKDIIPALKEIAKLKGIDEEMLFTTLEDALTAAYKKGDGTQTQDVRSVVNRENGDIKIFNRRLVVEEVEDEDSQISVEDAKEIKKTYEVGDVVEEDVTPKDFMRVAAQSAKQIVTQRIKEAERSIIYNEFAEKEFDLISGIVQRADKGNVYVDLGKIEAILGPNEQIPGETYRFNERIQLYIVEVKQNTKGPLVAVSRTHPGLVKRLFEREVPEIYEGVVEIKSISREPGSRTKIAVFSKDENVDATGACVGNKGQRVQNIVNELKSEKIDIIEWDKDPAKYIANSLSPAKVIAVYINEPENSAKVIVDSNQLSLAIGKEGQNVRLAAKLTNWKIDIKSEKDVEGMALENIYLTEEEKKKLKDKSEKKDSSNLESESEETKSENTEAEVEDSNKAVSSEKAETETSDENNTEENNEDNTEVINEENNEVETEENSEAKSDDEFNFTGSVEDMFIEPDFELEEKEGYVEEVEEVHHKKKDKKKKKHDEEEDEDDFETRKKSKSKSRKSKSMDDDF